MECSGQAPQSTQNGEASRGDPDSLQAYPQNGNSPEPEDWDGQEVILTGPGNQDVQRVHSGPASQGPHVPRDFTLGLTLCYYYLEILNNFFFNMGVRIFILHWAPQITWPILDIHTLVKNSHCINVHILKAKGLKNLLLTQAKKQLFKSLKSQHWLIQKAKCSCYL